MDRQKFLIFHAVSPETLLWEFQLTLCTWCTGFPSLKMTLKVLSFLNVSRKLNSQKKKQLILPLNILQVGIEESRQVVP